MIEPVCLIVNADDYGYSDGVSLGILEGGEKGLITATGVLANSAYFDRHITWLKEADYLDMGVHLNLTYGSPLSGAMRSYLARRHGEFPGKYSLAMAVLTRRLPVDVVQEEWRCQIHRCKEAGLEIHFLNAHEHLHALPSLLTVLLKLAEEFNVPYIRCPEPEWHGWRGIGSMVRNTLLQVLYLLNRRRIPKGTPTLLGMNDSGRLSIAYLKDRLVKLQGEKAFELMCHPGYFNPGEIADPGICSYHNWQQELDLLKGREFRDLCKVLNIQVIRYRDLQGKDQ